MKGTFHAYGTFETSGPHIPVVPVVAAVATLAFLAWLATHLLVVAIIGAVVLAALVAAGRWMRRRYPDYSASVTEQAKALRADIEAHAPRPAVTVVNNYYLPPGATAGEANWAPLVRGTVEPERKRDQ
jgi:hypothetical protein